jgi:predicted DCC family thiol-disulfide oxidoreductase YuxK
MSAGQSTLVYDGDCGICRIWVNYWRGLTGDAIIYRPYQEAASEFPAIPLEAFRDAVQLIEPEGSVLAGAAATYRVLSHAPARAGWWWLYTHLPGFSSASEWAYAFLGRHRGFLSRMTRLLWGRVLEPVRYELVSWVFLRLVGAIYVAAFASLAVQIEGLVGHAGILPLHDYLEAAYQDLGSGAYRILPTLFWLDWSDTALIAGTFIGTVLGMLVILGRWTRPALVGLFALYLSCVHAGQDFMSFQWDSLLLETGFLAIFLADGSRIVVWLYRWLVFRYFLLAGAAKLLSGDPTWRDLTALDYHFWTQPLPTPIACMPHSCRGGSCSQDRPRLSSSRSRASFSSSCHDARAPRRPASSSCSKR